jgi:hypothetical protein
VTGLAQPHLGKLFGVDKETICFYLVHCKLLNKAQGTVEFNEWEGYVLSFPASTKRGARSQAKPNQRVQLTLIHSKTGLGRQTAQYFLELSDPLTSTSTITSKERRSGKSNQTFPLMWPNLHGMVFPKPQQAPLEVRLKKNQKARSNDDHGKRKVRRVSTNASSTTTASLHVDTPVVTENAITTSAASIDQEESILNMGKMIQDLAHADNAKVNTAIDASLDLDFMRDRLKRESFVTAGGCLALVQLVKKCVDKALNIIPACGQVTELDELAELTTVHKTLHIMIRLTFYHEETRVLITAIGGVEAFVKIMKTFPKCQTLQECTCRVLVNLACTNVTIKANIIKSGGIEVLLAAVNNHMDCHYVCENACECWALVNTVNGSRENTELLITLGGGDAFAKVRRKWPDNDLVQTQVRHLINLIVAEMKASG